MLLSPFSAQKLTTFVSRENAEDLTELADLVDSGQVTPAIDRVFALHETADAIRHLEAGHARGKVVVTPLRRSPDGGIGPPERPEEHVTG
jgi:NADPH:quinone reductase-like Zn-dependent oxidoreductase